MIALYDDEVRVFDAWGVWVYEGAPVWRKAIERWFMSPWMSLRGTPQNPGVRAGRCKIGMIPASC
jgi:hypothetical protein